MGIRKIGIFSAIVLLSLAMATLTASAATTTVTIQSAEVNVSESTTVPIMINDVTGVKGAHILLEYDSSVVHAIDIGNSGFSMETYKEINNVTGYVRYAVFNVAALTGDIKFADVTLKGISVGESPLNLTVVSLSDGTAEIPRDVINGTFTIQADNTAPIVKKPSAEPMIIPEDTDNEPLWGELAELMVNATDECGIDNITVTVNLSSVDKEVKVMNNIGNFIEGGTQWAIFNCTTNASIGTAGWNGSAYVPYQLEVNATDKYSNSNTSVSIELIVMKNGDVDESGAINLDDGIYLINYALLVPGYDVIPEIADIDGNEGPPNLDDGIFLVNHALLVPGYGILN